jgi:glycosyltransferase involved in cell wall biosynthesis
MSSEFQKKACTCIVPFYNEGQRVLHVLSVLTKVRSLTQIIAVDGGSTDNVYKKIQQKFPQVKLVRMEEKKGKSATVKEGLQLVKTEYVMLFDADIYNFIEAEVENAIDIIMRDDTVDMLILRRIYEPLIFKLTRGELVLSGERILRTKDLLRIYSDELKSYQVELAINLYMIEQNKRAYWFAYSGRNVLKSQKVGIVRGFLNELAMYHH